MSYKYRKEMNELVYKYASQGLNNVEIAHNLGISEKTLYEWKLKHKKFAKNLEAGKKSLISQVESALYKKAIGYNYEEEKVYVSKTTDGKEIVRKEKIKKHLPPDTGAIAFFLKNREPKRWNEKQIIQHEGEITKIVINPSNKKSKLEEEIENGNDD